MGIPNKPSVANPDLIIQDSWGGTQVKYTVAQASQGYGTGTLLGRKFAATAKNYENEYNRKWIKYCVDSIGYLAQNIEFYNDGGTANAISLTIASGDEPTAYTDGMKVRFFKNLANTSSVTINVESIGAKALKNIDGSALTGGELINNQLIEAVYDLDNDYFVTGTVSTNTTIGGITYFTTGSAPTGYLYCNGAAVSRSTYSALFAKIGTTFGAGDNSTTFNLPDLRGRVLTGYTSAETEFDAIGETGGAKTHTLSASEMPIHNHTINDPGHTHNGTALYGSTIGTPGGYTGPFGSVASWGAIGSSATGITINNAGSGGAHNNLQPYITLLPCIKY